MTRLTILQTADLHGQLETHDEFYIVEGEPTYRRAGGVAQMKTLIETIRAENPNTIVVDNGDCFQGSGWVQLTKGEAMVPVINELGYDVVMPGNWEVVFGKDALLELTGRYTSDVICTNMHDAEPGSGNPPDPRGNDVLGNLMFKPYTVREVGGVRVGLLAYNDPQLTKRQAPAYSTGIALTKPAQTLAYWVKVLREEERCDVVLVMGHFGIAPQVALASSEAAKGVDYILGGDTHERICEPIQGTYARVTEPGAFGSFVGRLELDVTDGVVTEVSYELLDVSEDIPEDPQMRAIVDRISAELPELAEPIGTTTEPIQRYYILETPMDNLITDALFAKVSAELEPRGKKLDIALSNGFRFGPPLVPTDGAATIDRQYLWTMLPENSPVKIGSVTGAQITTWLEKELNNVFSPRADEVFGGWVVRFAGMTVRFVSDAPMGRRLREVAIGGERPDPERRYLVAACERGGDPQGVLCRLRNIEDAEVLGFTLHDAVTEFLAEKGSVAYGLEGRCVAEDLPARVLGQGSVEGYEFR